MNSGLSGFNNAPVTKAVVIVSAVSSLLVGTRGASPFFSLSYQALFQQQQYWRLFPASLVFRSSPEAIFGLYLVYFFRVFERQIGSNKYSVFALFSTVVSSILQVAAIGLLKEAEFALAPGPYGFIFASFVPFCFDIPVSTRFTIFTVQFSDKTFLYLAGLQLLLSSWRQSLVPGIAGLLAGMLYRSNIFAIRRAKFPEAVAAAASSLLRPLLTSSRTPASMRAGAPTTAPRPASLGRPSQGFQDQLQGQTSLLPGGQTTLAPSAPPVPAVVPPSAEALAALEAMGFDRGVATRALMQCNNDPTMATNLLLESQSL